MTNGQPPDPLAGILPAHLRAFIGGAMGRSFELLWENGAIGYRRYGRFATLEGEERLQPTNDAWLAFWTELERLTVWNWRETYETVGVCDGTHWSLELSHQERTLRTHGSNAYPPEGADEPTPVFDGVCAAIELLLDEGRPFR